MRALAAAAAVLLALSLMVGVATAAEGKMEAGVVNLQFAADAKELMKNNEVHGATTLKPSRTPSNPPWLPASHSLQVVVIGLFSDSPDQKKARGVFRKVGGSQEFAGVGMVVADSTEERLIKVRACAKAVPR